jgi:cytochrome c-type biogenesis protein CcmF
MAALGSFLLLATFVVCSYAAVASVVGARRHSSRLTESGIGAFYLVTALMTAASAVIVNAFITDDFSIKYVSRYSESAQPLFYKLTAYWGGLDGSIMFWVFLLSVFGAIAVAVNRVRHRELIPYVIAVISTVQMFFLYLMMVHNNPFTTYIMQTPPDGEGLTPLLQTYWMVIHPPSLYIGFVGMTIPFAFGMAALITGHLDDTWLRAVRRWTMFAWFFLSLGLTLGMIWAYEELAWGGYWGWDPVENAGLLPWFTATAFLHSVMVQERRSMLRIWNVTLVIVTFFLTIFGTFMTRSGVVSSVHAFGENPEMGRLFTIFMIATLTFSFGWVIYRLPLLRARNELDSWLSREAAFLVNNWILLFSAFFILFATMFPTLSEAVTGDRITVGPPFFNRWMQPIGLTLLFLTGVGPLLAWRKSAVSSLMHSFFFPVTAALVTGAAFVALGFRVWVSGICFALCAMVAGTILQEFWRGAKVRQQATGTDVLTALIGLVGRNKRRYGGYVVHLGIVLIFFGFAGEGFKLEQQVLLRPGEQTTIGDYTARYDRLRVSEDSQKQMVTAYVTLFKNGQEVDVMYPAKWFFHKRPDEPTTEVMIRRTLAEDFYIFMASYEPGTQAASFQLDVNPLVNWVWLGFGMLALGTGIALLPERTFAFATARSGAEVAGTTAALILMVLLSGGTARAQGVTEPAAQGHSETSQIDPHPLRTDAEKRVGERLVCFCGSPGCGKEIVGTCACSEAAKMRGDIRALFDAGKTEEEVIDFYVSRYGTEILSAPPDRGFNRLAWLFPYVVGAGGGVLIGVTALRWSRRAQQRPAGAAVAEDPVLAERLDDELRILD